MQKKLALARTIAVILGILLLIAIIVIVNQHNTIAKLQAPLMRNITAQQDIIRDDCTATDPNSQERCAADLQKLSDLLAQFSKQRAAAGATTTLPSGMNSAVNNVQVQKLPTR